MNYAGWRMLFLHTVLALVHLMKGMAAGEKPCTPLIIILFYYRLW